MPIPGDVPGQFRPGVQNDNAKLDQLAAQVRRAVQRAEPPLEISDTPGGSTVRDTREPDRLARLDAQDGSDNKWGWTEMLGRADGTVVVMPGGFVAAATKKYAVPVTGSGATNAIGIVRPKGDYYEFVPAVGGGLTVSGSQNAFSFSISGGSGQGTAAVALPAGTYLIAGEGYLSVSAPTTFAQFDMTFFGGSGTAVGGPYLAWHASVSQSAGVAHFWGLLVVTAAGDLIVTAATVGSGSATGAVFLTKLL